MKKSRLALGIILAASIAIVVYLHTQNNFPSPNTTSTPTYSTQQAPPENNAGRLHNLHAALTRGTTDSERDKEDIKKLKRELEVTREKLERITRPLEKNVLSSTVNAEIKPGETLVTGGYRTSNGNHELTLLTPRSLILEDGREAIEMDGKVLSVGTEFISAHGLEPLVTNARNTLQHAEAWMQDEVSKTLSAAREAKETGIFSSPKILTIPSEPFTLSMSDSDGAQFSLEGRVTRNLNGNFVIQSRVERTPKAE